MSPPTNPAANAPPHSTAPSLAPSTPSRFLRISRRYRGLPWVELSIGGLAVVVFEAWIFSLPPAQRVFALRMQFFLIVVFLLFAINRYIWRRLVVDTRLAATRLSFFRVALGVFSLLVVICFPLGRVYVYTEPGLLALVAFSCLGCFFLLTSSVALMDFVFMLFFFNSSLPVNVKLSKSSADLLREADSGAEDPGAALLSASGSSSAAQILNRAGKHGHQAHQTHPDATATSAAVSRPKKPPVFLRTLQKMLAGSAVAKARVKAALAVALSLTLSSIAIWNGLQPPTLVHQELTLQRLPSAFDGLVLVQISDIHLGPTIGKSFLASVVDRVNALSPDIVVISGDLVDAHISLVREATEPLTKLKTRLGVYYSTGNHEYLHGDVDETLAQLSSVGLKLLRNERVKIMDPSGSGEFFYLAGVDDYQSSMYGLESHGHDMAKALRGIDPSREIVAIAHQPRSISDASLSGVGLLLMGHTHGGQIAPLIIGVYIANFGFIAGLYEVAGKIPAPTTDTNSDGELDAVFKAPTELQTESPSGSNIEVAKLGTKTARRSREVDHIMYAYVNSGTAQWGPRLRLLSTAEITRFVLHSREK